MNKFAVTGWFVLLAAVASLGGTCGGGPTPSSETCQADGLRGTVSDVTLGSFDGTTFTAFRDGDIVPMIYGGQGSPMIVVNLRVNGLDLGTCLPQSTRIRGSDGNVESSEELPLVIRQVVPGTFISGEALLVTYDVYGGEYVTLESTVGGITSTVDVWVDYVGSVPDAGLPVDAAAP